jgi:hypothetical protein
MDQIIEKYITAIIEAKWWKEKLYWIPTDIIWFWEFGRNLAYALEPLVTKKEICFFDLNIKHDDNFHFLNFIDMFKKSELMIFTQELPEEFLNDLSELNQNITIIIDWKFTATIKILSDNWFSKNIVII